MIGGDMKIDSLNVRNAYLQKAKEGTQKALNGSLKRVAKGENEANLIALEKQQNSSLKQDIANANEAIAMLQIADRALSSVSRFGLNSDQQKIVNEANLAVEKINKSLQSVNFDGKSGENLLKNLDLFVANLHDINANNGKSLSKFISSLNSLRGEISSTQNAIFADINANLAKNLVLKSNLSEFANDDLIKNLGENLQNFKLNQPSFTKAHTTQILQNQISTLLG